MAAVVCTALIAAGPLCGPVSAHDPAAGRGVPPAPPVALTAAVGASEGTRWELLDPAATRQVFAAFAAYLDGRLAGDLAAFAAWWETLAAALTPPAPRSPTVAPPMRPPTLPAAAGGGGHSDAWWSGVSVCEQGGRNDPYFGYFSIMDGSAGGLDWSTQVGMANGIISRYGD